MADFIKVGYAGVGEGVAAMQQAHRDLDAQAQQAEDAFNKLASIWTGQAQQAALTHASRIHLSRQNLNQTLALLASAVNEHMENVRAQDVRNATQIGGVG